MSLTPIRLMATFASGATRISSTPSWPLAALSVSVLLLCASFATQAADAANEANAGATADRLDELQRLVNGQIERMEALKRAMQQEESSLGDLRRALRVELLASQRARGVGVPETVAQAGTGSPQPVGQAPDAEGRAPAVAPIFEQGGVLTPKGKAVLEPSFQYSYSSSNRIALVGYTVIPAILVGVVDVREVKRNTFAAALTGRYGLTNRWEIEARLPYVYRADTSIGREILQGQSNNAAFNSSGNGIGDVEITARHQLNDGGVDKPFFIGSLRFKSRTQKENEIRKIKNSWKTIHFEFATPYYGQENVLEYSYRLKGFDNNWSEWSTISDKEYTNLPANNYTFEVKVRNSTTIESEITTYKFTMLPPWYKSIWAYIIYFFIFCYGIYFYNKTQQKKFYNQSIKNEEEQKKQQIGRAHV